MEEFQAELKAREGIVGDNILKSISQKEEVKPMNEDDIRKSLSNLDEDQLTAHLAKSWNTMNCTQDPLKRMKIEKHVNLVKEELKSRR